MKKGADGKTRCFGNGDKQELYADYHDNEWSIPSHDDQHLFEMLILEGAQAGLNWETVLKKREAYRKDFYNFDPKKVSNMSDRQLQKILQNPGIIRNKLKIYSARKNAKVFLDIQQEFGSFDHYVWQLVNDTPIKNHWHQFEDVPASTPESIALSKDLKKRGMSFVGPTIMYAYMQAVGMVNDHLVGCWRYVN